MDEKVKYWLLLAIREYSKNKNITIYYLFNQRPNFVTDDLTKFFSLIKELKKEGLIQINQIFLSQYCSLTKKGQKEIERYLIKAKASKFISLIKLIPEAELRYRIRAIEGFLGSLLLMIIFGLFEFSLITNKVANMYLHFIFASFVFFFLAGTIGCAAFVIFNFLDSFIRYISLSLSEFLNKYKEPILAISIILAIVVVITIFVKNTSYDFSDIMYCVLGGLIILIITKFNETKGFLRNRLKFNESR